jgi:hypothetical protein
MSEIQYYRLTDVSRATGMSTKFIRREVARGHLPITRLSRAICVADEDLRAYLAARRVKTQAVAQ